jgi:hypothetical protein
MTALRADCRFFRRRRETTRAYRSPKTPVSVAPAENPGIENSSRSVRADFMG